jgi:DNA-binding cell septation regulator SpoVG
MATKITVKRCFNGKGNLLKIADVGIGSAIVVRNIKVWQSKNPEGGKFIEWPTVEQTEWEKTNSRPKQRAVAFNFEEGKDKTLTSASKELQDAIIAEIMSATVTERKAKAGGEDTSFGYGANAGADVS